MKINEIIIESDVPANPKKLDGTQVASLSSAVSTPGISMNKSNGNAYAQYRFGLALAGAHPDKSKSEVTPAAGAFAGDPVMLAYSDADRKMIKNASDMVQAGQLIPLGSKKSEEGPGIYKNSPTAKPKKNKYGI